MLNKHSFYQTQMLFHNHYCVLLVLYVTILLIDVSMHIYVHPYKRNWSLQFFSHNNPQEVNDLALHTTSFAHHSLKWTPNDKFLRNFFMEIFFFSFFFFFLSEFAKRMQGGSRQTNYFFISFCLRYLSRDFNHGLLSDESTVYLLNCVDVSLSSTTFHKNSRAYLDCQGSLFAKFKLEIGKNLKSSAKAS